MVGNLSSAVSPLLDLTIFERLKSFRQPGSDIDISRISTQQGASIRDVGKWVEGSWVWSLEWSRELLDRDRDSVENLLRSLRGFSLVEGRRYRWVWTKEGSGEYTVSSAYDCLQGDYAVSKLEAITFNRLWSVKAPSNAISLAWKILLQRIQTKDELAKRRALPVGIGLDLFCGDHEESCLHLFLECRFAWGIWMRILNWVGISTALPNSLVALFIQFGSNIASSSKSRKTISAIWIATVCALWKARNKVAFRRELLEAGEIC
ncbi:uncharacterized protein LOC130744167 [Lotus japonicus]|uniref:uncharacterized protein LOC130744167 n=1 Tax=Lotus japonicus TaxID=34305 RepID=UPI00258A2197|nr:uncharacterized protein LOC130744167 [Lotus japonicus]